MRSRCVRSRSVRFAMNHKLQSVHMYVGQRIDSFDSFDAFLKIKIIKKSYPSSSFRTSTHVRTYLLYSVYRYIVVLLYTGILLPYIKYTYILYVLFSYSIVFVTPYSTASSILGKMLSLAKSKQIKNLIIVNPSKFYNFKSFPK